MLKQFKPIFHKFLVKIVFALLLALQVICPIVLNASEKEVSIRKGLPWNPVQSDQWVATDNLSRSLPTHEEVGETRPDKYIACFYFLWNGRHGDDGPYDISKILAEHPEAKDDPNSPYWGKMYVPHHWAESIFGYYVGEDEAVLRKHAQMLGDAGVDVICFDVTNQLTYPESYRPLFKVFSEMQKEGNKVPKVAFLCPFWAPNNVVRELWREVYSKDFFSDVWFNWKGKPLILADPDMLSPHVNVSSSGCVPVELQDDTVLMQKFEITQPFTKLVFNSPTWEKKNSSVSLTVRNEAGEAIEHVNDLKVSDNAPYSITFKKALPAGVYSVEMRKGSGTQVGWWARDCESGKYQERANEIYKVDFVKWLETTQNGKQIDKVFVLNIAKYDEETEKILNFFTFRPSQPDYFMGQTKVNQWSWLEAYPQNEYFNDKNELEQMSVGVAQNAVDGKLGVLSNPRAYGRSFHNGSEPAPEDCDYTGKNFQEQWDRALKIAPEIIFITGWNEWIAGRFDINAPFHGATPVSFVDQYNTEFSRDCEPMIGGHEDAYYYQFIANIRRFKGVSRPQIAQPKPISIDGVFDDWKNVKPIYYDTVSDPMHRNCRGWGKGTRYVNNTGRNDFIQAQASYDANNVYFYVKTKEVIQGDFASENWISLLIDADQNPKTGIKGNDFVVISNGKTFVLAKATDEKFDTDNAVEIEYKLCGSELELAIPRDMLGLDNTPNFDFKWIDGININANWSAFTTDGDAAPNDRYYYRYTTGLKKR